MVFLGGGFFVYIYIHCSPRSLFLFFLVARIYVKLSFTLTRFHLFLMRWRGRTFLMISYVVYLLPTSRSTILVFRVINGSGSKCRLLQHESWKLGIRQWRYQGRISTLRCSMRWGQGCWIHCFDNTGGSVKLKLAQRLLFIKCVTVQLSAELTIGRAWWEIYRFLDSILLRSYQLQTWHRRSFVSS